MFWYNVETRICSIWVCNEIYKKILIKVVIKHVCWMVTTVYFISSNIPDCIFLCYKYSVISYRYSLGDFSKVSARRCFPRERWFSLHYPNKCKFLNMFIHVVSKTLRLIQTYILLNILHAQHSFHKLLQFFSLQLSPRPV